MTYYVKTETHGFRGPAIDRSGQWPRVTFAWWTWDAMPDAIFGRILATIAELRGKRS